MPIKQLTYYIPPNLEIGIMSGIYKRFGGVVRNAKTGEIVKHLNEVGEPTKKAGSAVMQAIKKHPVATIGIGVVATATTATISYFVKKKKEKEYKTNSPKCIIKFDTSLQKYIRAVRKGTLDEKIIDNLMKSLDRIDKAQNTDYWTLYDILYRNYCIEIKQTSYYHPWNEKRKISNVRRFGITMANSNYDSENTENKFERQNDIYVFCLNTGNTKESSNPMNLDNWEFYIAPTKSINEKCRNNKTIGLNKVKEISKQVTYDKIKAVIDEIIDSNR